MQTDRTFRLHKIDALRGITLISMIAYHALWDIVYILHKDIYWYRGLPGFIWQQSICWTFILLSGFSFTLGHHQIRRGITVSVCGLLVTAATLLFSPGEAVIFGILTFMGAAMLLTAAVSRAGIDKKLLLIPSVILFLLTRDISGNACVSGNYLTAFFGFPFPGFTSTDYFPLIPWFFLYLTGYALSGSVTEKGRELMAGSLCPTLEFIGRHTLLIYMLHQPVIMGIIRVIQP